MIKSNPLSLFAGMAMPSLSIKTIAYRAARAHGLNREASTEISRRAYLAFRNMGITERWSYLASLTPAKVTALIKQMAPKHSAKRSEKHGAKHAKRTPAENRAARRVAV